MADQPSDVTELILPGFVQTTKDWWTRNIYKKDSLITDIKFKGRYGSSSWHLRSTREIICQSISDNHGVEETRWFKPGRKGITQ